ncbi:MAG: YtxH domain-containing protein [Bacilli bacterium]|nr:YtxH domain-containing protein [Bacilli bacterium]
MSRPGIGTFLLGLGIGVGVGMLISPNTGEENRKIVKEKAEELANKIKDIDLNEVKDNLVKSYDKLKKELQEMDVEKAKKIAAKKINELTEKANQLLAAAKEKADPVIEEETKKIKKNLSNLLNTWADKLED